MNYGAGNLLYLYTYNIYKQHNMASNFKNNK